MEFIKLSLNDNLLEKALQLAPQEAVLVFPTRSAAGYAQSRYWDSFAWQDWQFMSMEDFEAAAILTDAPVLTDEKRLICLYLVLSEAERDYLHIMSYGDVVPWGKRFFDFFGELAEECIEAEELLSRVENGQLNLQEWQELYLQRILEIRKHYQSYIQALGFTDRIFYLQPRNFANPWPKKHLVFVNQFYYNALHKRLLQYLEQAGNAITIIYQGLELNQQDGDWQVRDFDLKAAWQNLEHKPQLRLIECESEDQMAVTFLSMLQNQELGFSGGMIIDSHFYQQAYQRFFDPQLFRYPQHYPISSTQLFQVISAIAEGMKATQSRRGCLPMQLIARLITKRSFAGYFAGNADEDTLRDLRSQLRIPLQEDYLYLDEAYLEAMEDCILKRTLLCYYKHLQAFGKVDSIGSLCELLDNPQGLMIGNLVAAEEAENTTILASFWQQVANFQAIEALGLIKDWTAIFTQEDLALNLLELFLEYLKATKVSYRALEPGPAPWEISNLLDSRNRTLEQVIFFQMIEGVVPAAPTPVWLFSETQRKRLGMKNYDDIRAWERYYFYRLLLTSKKAICFSYRNLEQDIVPSSFLGELQLLYADNGETLFAEKSSWNLSDIYASRLGEQAQLAATGDASPGEEFFILPAEPERDFGEEGVLKSSVSGLLQFIKNPFLWYIEARSKIYATPYEAVETIGAKLFGNIMHDYFAVILDRYRGHHEHEKRLEALFGDQQALQEELLKIIATGKYRYQIPRNYNGEFLGDVISTCLAASLQLFYEKWLRAKIYHKSFELIPENLDKQKSEQPCKTLGAVRHAGKVYSIQAKGRADLRLELEQEVLIIDFKTGGKDINQLIIYEWLYYLLDGVIAEENISSVFWMILDAEASHERITKDKREALKTRLLETFSTCLSKGYFQGKKVADRQRLKEITRADLYHPSKEEADA